MKEPNKRPHSEDDTSSTPIKQNSKKKDNKTTPNKTNTGQSKQSVIEETNIADVPIIKDISLIQHDDSIWTTSSNEDLDEILQDNDTITFDQNSYSEEGNNTDLKDEEIFSIIEKFGKIGFITHKEDDSIIQALINVMGIQINHEFLIQEAVTTYLNAQQEWFKVDSQAEEALKGNCYRILAKCIGYTIKKKNNITTDQINNTKNKIRTKFGNINTSSAYVVAHVQNLSKLNGIFFPRGTISDDGKQSTINRIIHLIDQKKHNIVSRDTFSIQKIKGFVASNSPTTKSPTTKIYTPVINPYAKKTNKHLPASAVTPEVQAQFNIAEDSNNTTPINKQTQNIKLVNAIEQDTNRTSNLQNKISRFEIRICMNANENEKGDIDQLRRQLKEVLDHIMEVDQHAKIWSWYNKEDDMPLNISDIPSNMKMINQYFPRLYPSKHGMIHGEFKMEHSRRWEDIINDITPWLSECRHGVYYQHLQCQQTTNLGWFLWSFRKIDTEILQKELLNILGINVSLRYQNVITDRNTTQMGNKVFALHAIVEKSEADRISNILKATYPYNQERDLFPLGIVLRFVPHIFRLQRSAIQKVVRLRNRQENFLNAIENPTRPMSAISWEIITLDTRRHSAGSLRDQVMQFKSSVRPKENLFLSVDTSFFRSNEVIFTFLPRNETEARAFVTNIVPRFIHELGTPIASEIFHGDAIHRAQGLQWNAMTGETESPDDMYLNTSGEGCDDFDILEYMGLEQNNSDRHTNNEFGNSQTMQRIERLFTGEDTDSIGTLASRKPNAATSFGNTFGEKMSIPTQKTGTSTSGQSNGTTLTMEEMSHSIVLLTEGFKSLEALVQAVFIGQNSSIQTPTKNKENNNIINNNIVGNIEMAADIQNEMDSCRME